MAEDKTYFGLDFGTTFSTISLLTKGGVLVYKQKGSEYIPTTLFIPEDEKYVMYGHAAESAYVTGVKGSYYKDLKRYVGCNSRNISRYLELMKPAYEVTTSKIGNSQTDSAVIEAYNKWPNSKRNLNDLISLFIKVIVCEVEVRLNVKCQGIILSVPAGYTCLQRAYMEECCKASGYRCVTIINEPSAASIATLSHLSPDHHDLLVYDFGGGTFDVSCISVYGTSVVVTGSSSDMNLGGRDIDAALSSHLSKKCGLTGQFELQVTSLKEALCVSPNPIKFNLKPYKDADVMVYPHEIAEIALPFIQRSVDTVRNLIESLGFSHKKYDIALVGGSSSLPGVKSILSSLYFCNKVVPFENSRAAVSIGCSIYAKAFDSNSQLILIDATSKDLGLASNKGNMLLLAPRAAPLPFNGKTSVTCPGKVSDSELLIYLYEGRSTRVLYNELLASTKVLCSQLGNTSQTAIDMVVHYETQISTTGRVTCKVSGENGVGITIHVQSVYDFEEGRLLKLSTLNEQTQRDRLIDAISVISYRKICKDVDSRDRLVIKELSELGQSELVGKYGLNDECLKSISMVLRSTFPGVLRREDVSFVPFEV
ncbi:heat shock 70-like protein [Fig virus A]|uniref:HSP70 n=1 Tax=Fig closterovirus 2 TaxID=2809011 RepID=A0A8A0XUS3_9CLOS|nr:heat shock 70-like protein [Fig virus A]QSQ86332.1 HSP70 [Fig closterovirus 2]